MTPEQLQTFKDTIQEATDNHLLQGGKILSGSFYRNGASCPITCVLGERPVGDPTDYLLGAKLGFNVTYPEVWSFIAGFDGADDSLTGQGETVEECLQLKDIYHFGQYMRAKYIK